MAAPGAPASSLGPDWVVAEMPPGYQTRVAEIQRLTAELESMTRFTRLLWTSGSLLAASIRDVFASLRMEADTLHDTDGRGLVVRLEGRGRLLFHVSADEQIVHKKSPEIARVFQMLHEVAEELDRVVFVTNAESGKRPADRGPALADDALAFLTRMGASHVTGPTLFALWKLSQQDSARAREQVQRLHAHGGGTFDLPAALLS